MPETLALVMIFFVGIMASFINIMAGGGSVLTLSAMMFLGLNAPVANGTNRIGLLVECISGATAFKKEKFTEINKSLIYGLFALPGAVIGSLFAINISNVLFQRILGVVMIFIVITLILPKKSDEQISSTAKASNALVYPMMFLIGLYGGFIQAGVGFIIMFSMRQLLKLDLVAINMYKVYIVLIYTIPVFLIFGLTRNINWYYAAALGSGNALGAWLSVRVSINKGEKVIKIVLVIAIMLMAFRFFLQ